MAIHHLRRHHSTAQWRRRMATSGRAQRSQEEPEKCPERAQGSQEEHRDRDD